LKYYHVDVFTSRPMSGNGLTVVFPKESPDAGAMLRIAQELRQFETAFVFPQSGGGAYPVRIFTMQEELPFAGHPVLGAAAVIHRVFYPSKTEAAVHIDLSGRSLTVESVSSDGLYIETMNQGVPEFLGAPSRELYEAVARAVGLSLEDLDPGFPMEVVSTGLKYLLVPVRNHLENARIAGSGFESFLGALGAKFVYLFDPKTLECRTWDNSGAVEDVATGSAAGPLCAYLVRRGVKKEGEIIRLSQGRYLSRPSVIEGWVQDGKVCIRGSVAFFASGEIKN
jgi:trans-2,3-dihydro-3-hydroxyanthranilate isomerase